MSKRKRERPDIGRDNDQKKHKPSREGGRVTLLHGKTEGLEKKEVEDKGVVAIAVDAGVKKESVKTVEKTKSRKNQKDSDSQKPSIKGAPSTSATPQNVAQPGNVSVSHEKPELTVSKLEKRKAKKTKAGEHPKNAGVPSNHHKDNRQKAKMGSQNERSSWKVSDPIGGQMLDLDPIFALNEE